MDGAKLKNFGELGAPCKAQQMTTEPTFRSLNELSTLDEFLAEEGKLEAFEAIAVKGAPGSRSLHFTGQRDGRTAGGALSQYQHPRSRTDRTGIFVARYRQQ